jgi:hypothetical protein
VVSGALRSAQLHFSTHLKPVASRKSGTAPTLACRTRICHIRFLLTAWVLAVGDVRHKVEFMSRPVED